MRQKLREKTEKKKEYLNQIKHMKSHQQVKNKTLTKLLNKSVDSENDRQNNLMEAIEVEKRKATHIKLRIDQVKLTSSKQEEEIMFLTQKLDRLMKSETLRDKEFFNAKSKKHISSAIGSNSTSYEELKQKYLELKNESDLMEKAYNDQIDQLKTSKNTQEAEWEAVNQKHNIILHRMKEIEHFVKTQDNAQHILSKQELRKELISRKIAPPFTHRSSTGVDLPYVTAYDSKDKANEI